VFVDEGRVLGDELLGAEEVARALGVEAVTVYRWCRQGRLACLKPGKAWRVRRSALDAFLRRAERPRTLAAHLGAFLETPDQVLVVAGDVGLLARLDAAFFQVAEARGGLLAKVYDPGAASEEALRTGLRRDGQDVDRLEAAGRLRWHPEPDPVAGAAFLGGLLRDEAAGEGRPVWVAFDWAAGVGLEVALRQQAALAELVAAHPVVAKTGMVEPVAETWPPLETQWRLLRSLRGVVRYGREGLVLSRVVPPPAA
jgi:excisionase family DNA binding protein